MATHGYHLHEYLREQDIPCPGCGYNLRGLTSTTCPECNQALELRVTLAEPALGPLIALLVPPIAAASFGMAVVAIVVVMSLYHGEWMPTEMTLPFFVAPLGFAVGGSTLAWRWGRETGRQRLRGLGRSERRQRIALVWVGGLVLFALYVAWLTQID